jgi:glycine cleavage system aminomethyltransferase T
MQGQRVTVTVDGESLTGSVTAVQYTRLAGRPVAVVALDESLADGRTELAVDVDELD